MGACQTGQVEIASLLLENKAHINIQNNDGLTALMLASQNGYAETVSLLAQHGADVNIKDKTGLSSLMLASYGYMGEASVLVQLTQNFVQYTKQGNCLKASHEETVWVLLQNGAQIDVQNNAGQSALMMASEKGNTEIVSLLLQNGTKIDQEDNDGWFPLMIASREGNTDTVSLLLQYGANVNMLRMMQEPPASMAASYSEHPGTISFILQKNNNMHGWSSLMIACLNGHTETALLLIQNGADVDKQDKDGMSSLMLASQNGHTETAACLLQNGAHVNMQSKDGWSASIKASQGGHQEMVSLLLQNGANIDAIMEGDKELDSFLQSIIIPELTLRSPHQNSRGTTALALAISLKQKEVALQLLEHGANPCIVDRFGNSALIEATKANSTAIAARIIAKMHDDPTILNHPNDEGLSALLIASSRGLIEIATLLLQAGANVDISNFSEYAFLHLPPQQLFVHQSR